MVKIESKIKKALHWQAPEFHFYEKDPKWFSKIAIAAVFIIAFFIILGVSQKQFSYYLAAAVVFAACLALFSQAKITPKNQEFKITLEGIEIIGQKLNWDQLKSFWLSDHTINFQLNKRFSLFPISAPLGDQNAEQIRDYILQFLPEKSNGESLVTEKINRLFKF